MISLPQRGASRGSYIIGKRAHSQRVELLKYNVFYTITALYYKNVQYLEEIMKRWANEVHVWALQYTLPP